MKEKTCCFTGHRDILKNERVIIRKRIENVVIGLIKKGIIYYGAGGARGFDTMAAEVILELRKLYPQIKLILVLPCREQTRGWSEQDKALYEMIKQSADKYVYISEKYWNGCMQKRNRHLVDNSSCCVCYLTKRYGGTFYTYNYAANKGLKIYNVSGEAEC